MRYESLLAGRYIKAQRRQSIFTVLSIAMAVTTMTVIFVLYGVAIYNARKTALEQKPYHLSLHQWPANKATALRNEKHVESVTFERNPDGSLTAWIFFDGYIGNKDNWRYQLGRENGVTIEDDMYDWNSVLIDLDLIDDDAILHMLLLFLVMLLFALLFCFALRLMVDTAFEISSKERERHYGVLQSIGATPKQIVGIITREGLRLCLRAIPLGLGAGTLMAYVIFRSALSAGTVEGVTRAEPEQVFAFSPLMPVTAAAVGIVWTFFSAYGVGMRVVKRTPIDAIQGRAKRVEKVKRRSLSGLLFGLPGKLAARNARREKKRFRITVLALTVSIVLFVLFTSLMNTIEDLLIAEATGNGYTKDFSARLREDPEAGIFLSDGMRILEDSGLFQRVELSSHNYFFTDYVTEDDRPAFFCVCYCNPTEYQEILGEHPAVSYEALAQNGEYVFAFSEEQPDAYFDVDLAKYFAKQAKIREYYLAEAETGRMKIYSRYFEQYGGWKPEELPHEVRVCAVDKVRSEEYYDPQGFLVGTLDTYLEIKDEWFGPEVQVHADMYCGPVETHSDEEYQRISSYLQDHAEYFEDGEFYGSYYGVLRAKEKMAPIRTAFLCLNLLFGLAALVNLVNIVSTGIANRRSELASLQCVGMTEGQLFRLSAVECLQYVLRAAVGSAAVVGAILGGVALIVNRLVKETRELLIGDTPRTLLNSFLHLDYATPFLRIALVAAAAFALSFAAAWIMLRSQNRYSLSARVRGDEFETRGKLPQN